MGNSFDAEQALDAPIDIAMISAKSPNLAADLVNAAPVVRCDEASWRLFGISLAGYNAVFSLGAAGLGAYLLSIKKTFLLRRRR